jgi:hypothetical protein
MIWRHWQSSLAEKISYNVAPFFFHQCGDTTSWHFYMFKMSFFNSHISQWAMTYVWVLGHILKNLTPSISDQTSARHCLYIFLISKYILKSVAVFTKFWGLGWLTPLSTPFQLHRGGQFYCWNETAATEENHWHVASHWQTISHNVVHLALIEIQITTSGPYDHDHNVPRKW